MQDFNKIRFFWQNNIKSLINEIDWQKMLIRMSHVYYALWLISFGYYNGFTNIVSGSTVSLVSASFGMCCISLAFYELITKRFPSQLMLCFRLTLCTIFLLSWNDVGSDTIAFVKAHAEEVIALLSGAFIFYLISGNSGYRNVVWDGNAFPTATARLRICEKKDSNRLIKNKKHSSIHEAGHCLIFASGNARTLLKETRVYLDGDYFSGFVEHYFDKQAYESESKARLRCLINLAGIGAEKSVFGESSLGGKSDLIVWDAFARIYIAHCNDKHIFLGDVNEQKEKANIEVLAKFKAEMLADLDLFFCINRNILIELGHHIEINPKTTGLELYPFLDKVKWPRDWPVVQF